MKTNNHTKKFIVRHRHPLSERIERASMTDSHVDLSWRESPPVNIQQAVEGANDLLQLDYEVEIIEVKR